jgi:hypothetical protein
MKSKKHISESDILILIHIALTSLILAMISWGSGCEKKDDLGQADLGPEIQIKDLAKAYVNSTENADNSRIDANFFTVYEINQRIELGPTLKYIDTLRTIKCILRSENETQIALNIETYLYDQYGNLTEKKPNIDYTIKTDSLDTQGLPDVEGESCPPAGEEVPPETQLETESNIANSINQNNNSPNNFEKKLSLYKSEIHKKILMNNEKSNSSYSNKLLSHVAKSVVAGLANFHSQRTNAIEALSETITEVTLHNLSVQNLNLDAPKNVKNKPGCSGIENCQFKAVQIQFDIVEWYNSTDYRITRSRWVVTPQLPSFAEGMNEGFGGFLSKCESGFQKITTENKSGNLIEQEYHITTCLDVLRNF